MVDASEENGESLGRVECVAPSVVVVVVTGFWESEGVVRDTGPADGG